MGALLTVLADIVELASITGLSAESILTGEAFTTAELLESHIANLVTVGGLTEAEALAATEVTPEAFAALRSLGPNLPHVLAGLAASELAANGAIVIGAAIAGALTPYNWYYSQPLAMADVEYPVAVWFPDFDEIAFPGVNSLARFLTNYMNPFHWTLSLFEAVDRLFWDTTIEVGRRLGDLGLDLAERTNQFYVSDQMAKFFENARWAVKAGTLDLYSFLSDYYKELPPLNPIRARQTAREQGEEPPYRYDRYTDPSWFEEATSFVSKMTDVIVTDVPKQQSGFYVVKYEPPGGAQQRISPDWMLPLILGLYGDVSPSWADSIKEIEEEEDGPQEGPPKKKRRALRSPKTNNKRRNRSASRPNRAR